MNDVKIVLTRSLNDAVHYHSEVEILFVVSGSAKVIIKNQSYELEQEDIIAVNSGEMHSVESSMNAVICDVHFSCRRILELVEEDMCVFECNSRTDRNRSYHTIRTVMREVVYQYIKREPGKTDCLKISALYKLLDCLIENYRNQSLTRISGRKMNNSERVQKIYQYVEQNYQYGISMSELANQLFISTSTLSRVFKKETGIYFADYVSGIRMSHAVAELLQTEKSVTAIAVDCGFSNPSVFDRSFKDIYGVTPSVFRTQKKEQMMEQERQTLLEQEKLRKELAEQLGEQSINIEGRVKVSVNVDQGRTFVNCWKDMMNIGSVDMLCGAAAQKQVLFLKNELGFRYARIWSIFSQKNMICTGKEGSNYNFNRLDYVLDFLLENNMIPFLDFGNRPDVANRELGNNVFETHDYILFESRAAWEACLSNFIEHIVQKYGKTEVSRWKFEFSSDRSNAPVSNYYSDQNYSYTEVFLYAWKTIKKLVPGAMVGGPMALIDFDEQFVKEFLSSCKEQNCIPDFVSMAVFPYRTRKVEGRAVSELAVMDNVEIEYIYQMQQVLLDTGCTNCKLYVTEWNNSVSNRNYLNDSIFRGAYFIQRIAELSESVDMLGIWMATDIISNYVDSNRIVNGGGGLLTQDGIPKPAFYALRFMNKLGDCLISKGENFIITSKSKTSYYIICYNLKGYNRDYFKKRERLDNPEDIEEIFENKDPVEISISLNNLPDNKSFIIMRRHMAANYGNLLGEWKNFQYDEHLSADNVKYIQEASFPRMSMERKKTKERSLHMSVMLEANEFVLLHIHEDKQATRT